MSEDMTNPAGPEVTGDASALEIEQAADVETEGESLAENSDDQAEVTAEEEETEEVERDGKKYRVPKALAGELLMQADYTRKTQAHADAVRQFQAEAQAEAQRIELQRANLQGYAQLHAIDAQLAEFRKVDWDAAADANPQQAQKAWMQFQTLQQQRSGLAQHISAQEQQLSAAQQHALQEQRERCRAEITKEIPDFEAIAPELGKYAVSSGYTLEELQHVADPRAIRILNKARLYDQLIAKSKQSQQPKQAAPQTPVRAINGKSSQPKPAAKMSDAEWYAHEQAKRRHGKS